MKRKKQGASLIAVIIIFMFLTTVSMAMLSMVLGNYKARVAESKRVENLYASDSGLDVAYNIIGKTFDAATKYGYFKVLTLKNGNNTGPNNDTYQIFKDDIDALTTDINNLISDKNNIQNNPQDYPDTDLSELDKQISQKRALIQEDKEFQQVLINEEFKRAFKNFIEKSDAKSAENVPDTQLKDFIENHQYISSVTSENIDDTDKSKETVEFGISNQASPTLTADPIDLVIVSGSLKTTGISASTGGHYETVEFNVSPDQEYYNIAVTSKFYSEKLNNISNDDDDNQESPKTNERQLKAQFNMSVPNFKDIYYQTAVGETQQYLATKDRAITVAGNMNLNNANGFTVNDGEVYVGGTTPPSVTVSNRSFAKYNGGIMVYDSNNVTFNKDVITRGTFNLRNEANVNILGNLYGRNVYIGGKRYNPEDLNDGLNNLAQGANLHVDTGEVVIDNDLGLKGDNSHVTIRDFYGVNDKKIYETDPYGKPVDIVKSSSSIIVNSHENNSSINITNSAYIMGTAHINTNDTSNDGSNEYQTGESGAVIGNYIAYTVPLDETERLSYYDPLQLLNEPNVITKAKHFFDYWTSEIGKKNYPDTGGIQLPLNQDGTIKTQNIHTLGALVYETTKEINGEKIVEKKVLDSTYNFDTDPQSPDSDVYKKKAEFASKVYKFNQSATKPYDYDKTIVTDFNSLVDTSKISSSGYDLTKQSNRGEYAIFNGDASKEIKIKKSSDSVDRIITSADTVEIQVGNKEGEYILNSVIVAAGNVSIDSDITIKGCVIVQGDLNIDQDNVKINYDSGVIKRVQAQNSDVFKAVFGGSIVDDNEGIGTSEDSTSGVASSYDLKNFLKKNMWTIIK